MAEYSNNEQVYADVERLVGRERYDEALALLNKAIGENTDAELFYRRGRLLWKLGKKTEAMSDYAKAVELDPDSPAAAALDLAREVMNFYNKDMYNP